LLAKHDAGNQPANALKRRIAEFAARVTRQRPHNAPQAFIYSKCIRVKPKPPDIADIYRFLIVHL
jgi:hypothetical protein